MVTFERAFETVCRNATQLGTERVRLAESLNCVLAEDIISDIDMPPFNKSAVDGFAIRRCDIKENLGIIETIAAGDIPQMAIGEKQCSKIMTGAMVPQGADCIVPVEHIENIPGTHITVTKYNISDNISIKGEDIVTGDLVLKKGTLILPQQVAILATVGCSQPLVWKRPAVAVISTGSELVEPDRVPGKVQIRNSNAWQIISQLQRINIKPAYYGIVGDSEEVTYEAVKKAISENNVVIMTGGVSMGDFDFVPEILKRNNVELLFEKILIKPGMPTVFGVNEKAFVFGLPGNPVSSYILFEVLVRPFLMKVMGHEGNAGTISLPMGVDYKRKRTERLSWIPAFINNKSEIVPVEYHGSAHILSLCKADVIFGVEIGISEIRKGEKVNVRFI